MKTFVSTIRIMALPTVIGAVITMAVTVSVVNAQEADEHEKPRFGADKSIVYKDCEGGDLQLHFFLPDQKAQAEPTEPLPAIIFFFGGGWNGGTPIQFKTHAAYFKSRGMIAVLADYRTKSSHKTTPKECVADAKSAMRFLRAHAEELNLDPHRIAAAGGSAGGHLAAATATVTEFNEPGENASVSAVPNALVLFNPVYDNGPGEWGHNRVRDFWEQISPAANIQSGIPAAIVFLGDADKLIPVTTAESFQQKMQDVGSRSDLHIYPGKSHGFFNFGRDNNVAFVDTVQKADAFLVELQFLQGESNVEEFLKGQE